jgi:prolyl 4-hydroxylase
MYMKKEIINLKPLIYIIEDFLSEEECNHIINISKKHFKKAIVSGAGSGKNIESSNRTNNTTWLEHYTDDVTKKICANVSSLVDIPLYNAEKMQVLEYFTGTKFDQHCDSYPKNGTQKSKYCLSQGGQRVVTCLMYLNNVKEGGETEFTKIKKKIIPKLGKIVIFYNCDLKNYDVIENSQHKANKVIKGVKYAVNLWFREERIDIPHKYLTLKKYNFNLNVFYKDILKGIINKKTIDCISLNESMELDILREFSKYHFTDKYIYDICNLKYLKLYDNLIINNTLNKNILLMLKNYYDYCIKNQKFIFGDNQTQRYKFNNDVISRILQYELLEFVKTITGENLVPTYTYFCGYIKDYDLPPHTDNPKCYITVSLLISKSVSEYNWPIYVDKNKNNNFTAGPKEKPDKEKCYELLCDVGGMILFKGEKSIHFREKLNIDNYNLVLMHYKIDN